MVCENDVGLKKQESERAPGDQDLSGPGPGNSIQEPKWPEYYPVLADRFGAQLTRVEWFHDGESWQYYVRWVIGSRIPKGIPGPG